MNSVQAHRDFQNSEATKSGAIYGFGDVYSTRHRICQPSLGVN